MYSSFNSSGPENVPVHPVDTLNPATQLWQPHLQENQDSDCAIIKMRHPLYARCVLEIVFSNYKTFLIAFTPSHSIPKFNAKNWNHLHFTIRSWIHVHSMIRQIWYDTPFVFDSGSIPNTAENWEVINTSRAQRQHVQRQTWQWILDLWDSLR